MKIIKNMTLAIAFVVMMSGYVFTQKITDIIHPVRLVAGQTADFKISDLYYASDYKIKFLPNKNLDVSFGFRDSLLRLTSKDDFEGITLLAFEYGKTTYQIPVVVGKVRYHTFSFKPLKQYKYLTVIGQFNGWSRQYTPMTDKNGDGTYEIDVPIEPGRYEYKFYGDGEEIVDYANKDSVPNGMGAYNSVIIIEKPFKNKVFLHNTGVKETKSYMLYQFFYENQGQAPLILKENVTALLDNQLIPENQIKVENNRITLNLERWGMKGNKLLRVAVTQNGQKSNWQYIFIQDGKPAGSGKFNWYDGIIYSIMIDRFKDGDKSINKPVVQDSVFPPANYNGGDFQGIIDKINDGYFDKLGINTIWISPINDNPNTAYREYPAPNRWYTGYHGYWPISDTKVEEQFGTMKKMKELVNTAHKKGIKILLDFVSHHVHQEHSWWKKHPEWFGTLDLPDGRKNLRLWDEYRLTTWFEPYIPSFDFTKSKAALKAMTENAIWWLEQTGADGFRHDAVKHVPNEFWRVLTAKIKKHFTGKRDIEVYQIGETFGDYAMISSYVNNGQLSAQFNFNLFDVAIVAFIDKNASLELIATEMEKTAEVYGPLHVMGNIMDSHDKIRYMAYADGDLAINDGEASEIGWNNPPKVDKLTSFDKLKLYYAYMLTIPGLPVIYYGSEFGMTGASDPDNRRMMYFGDKLTRHEQKTLDEVSKLINLRKKHSALRYGDVLTVLASHNQLGYIRSDANERILVLLNKSEKEEVVTVDIPEYYEVGYAENPLTKERIILEQNRIKVKIAPSGYEIFILDK